MPSFWPAAAGGKAIVIVLGGWAILATAAWWLELGRGDPSADHPPAPQLRDVSVVSEAADHERIEFSRDSWTAASLTIEQVQARPFTQSVELTGKIALNEDRIAHIFPLIQGRVDEVKIQLGDQVKQNDLLVVVQSREVGDAMLQLYQDRMQLEFAITKDRWMQTVAENTQAMIELIRAGAPIEDIEQQLTNKPVGQYRDTLMSAYIAHYKAEMHHERLAPLAQGGAVTGRQLLEAEAEQNATRATLQSLVEQIQQDVQQASAVSTQAVKELQTRVSVGETNLKILGFRDEALAEVNPKLQGDQVAHYPIYAPFDGTIISKDVVLMERVGPESQILGIADLSSVWVAADVYEEQLPLLQQLGNNSIRIRSGAWPDRTFEAQIFYAGDLVNEASRTLSMRAVADNTHGLLKPGMFVTIELPTTSTEPVTQVPTAAVQEHEGQTFVFLHSGDDRFERREVVVGRRSGDFVEVTSGLQPGEQVVTGGGFALKSRMLADLLAE